MVEFGAKPSESSNPHEGEGLSLTHWELLAKTPFKDPKINRFAKAVVNGELGGDLDNHRQHLGSRHWKVVAESLSRKAKGVTGIVLGFRNRELLKSTQQLANYAHYEQEISYTLDDYYASRGGYVSEALPDQEAGFLFHGYYSYIWDGAKWTITNNYLAGLDTNGQGGYPAGNSRTANHKDLNTVLQEFLLTFDDVPWDANLKSPQQLIEIAKRVDGKILNDRLIKRVICSKNWLELTPYAYRDVSTRSDIARKKIPTFQRVGNWEKEI